MLRVWRFSGELLADVSTDTFKDVRAKKDHLCKLHGFPVCTQRLVHDGCILDDATRVDKPIDVQLVLESISAPYVTLQLANALISEARRAGCASCWKLAQVQRPLPAPRPPGDSGCAPESRC